MKTAVQWLKEQYIDRGETIPSGVFQEALEMEKEQIIDAYNQADLDGYLQKTYPKYAEKYYNETYNQDRELAKDVKDLLDNYKPKTT